MILSNNLRISDHCHHTYTFLQILS